MSPLRVASGACIALITTCLLASCGDGEPEPLRPASEIVFQGTLKPIKPFPTTVLQPGDLPAKPVATIWPYVTPSPMRTWQCPSVGPGRMNDGRPDVRVTYDIGGDLISTAYYSDVWDGLYGELEADWKLCLAEVAKRGHPDGTSRIDLGKDAFGYVSRRVDGTVEGEEGFAKVDGDLVGVTVISNGGREPSVSVKDLLPLAVERARSGR